MCYKTIFNVKLLFCFHFRVEVSIEEEEDAEEECVGENSSDWLQSDGDLSVGAAHSKINIRYFAISVSPPDTLRIFTSLRVILVL